MAGIAGHRHVAEVGVVDRVEHLRDEIAVGIVDRGDQRLDGRARCRDNINAQGDRTAVGNVKCAGSIVNLIAVVPPACRDRAGNDREGVASAGQQLPGFEPLGTENQLPDADVDWIETGSWALLGH